ncbi:MAG: RNA polymerase sigma factor [Verrucomicrobiales bacterium]
MTPSPEISTAHLAWQTWFQNNGNKLLLFARQMTRSAADAEDVLQNAIVRCWNARKNRNGGVDPENAPDPAEIYTMIRRAAIDLGRRETRRARREEKVIDFEEAKGIDWFQCPFETKEKATEISGALRKLPDSQREVLTLKIWNQLTFQEIGETLGISENTAASRYRYALEALRRILGKGKESHFKNLAVVL